MDAGVVRAGSNGAVLDGCSPSRKPTARRCRQCWKGKVSWSRGGEVTLGREIRAEGRTVARVNGRSVAVGLLKRLAPI